MKKVLGLDLGVGSIGWSLIALDEDQRPAEILGMGCRIVPPHAALVAACRCSAPGRQLSLP